MKSKLVFKAISIFSIAAFSNLSSALSVDCHGGNFNTGGPLGHVQTAYTDSWTEALEQQIAGYFYVHAEVLFAGVVQDSDDYLAWKPAGFNRQVYHWAQGSENGIQVRMETDALFGNGEYSHEDFDDCSWIYWDY